MSCAHPAVQRVSLWRMLQRMLSGCLQPSHIISYHACGGSRRLVRSFDAALDDRDVQRVGALGGALREKAAKFGERGWNWATFTYHVGVCVCV